MLLVLVLLAAAAVARTCGSQDEEISQDEAVEIATEQVGFEPCSEPRCVQVRFLQRGIPARGVWLVGLAREIDEDGEPVDARSVLVDVQTGDILHP